MTYQSLKTTPFSQTARLNRVHICMYSILSQNGMVYQNLKATQPRKTALLKRVYKIHYSVQNLREFKSNITLHDQPEFKSYTTKKHCTVYQRLAVKTARPNRVKSNSTKKHCTVYQSLAVKNARANRVKSNSTKKHSVKTTRANMIKPECQSNFNYLYSTLVCL